MTSPQKYLNWNDPFAETSLDSNVTRVLNWVAGSSAPKDIVEQLSRLEERMKSPPQRSR